MWGMNPVDMMTDYLKFKDITIIGAILYPVLAPIFLGVLGFFFLKVYFQK